MKNRKTKKIQSLILATLFGAGLFGAAAPAYANCKYVTVNGKSVYVCDQRNGNNCGHVVVDGKSQYVCG